MKNSVTFARSSVERHANIKINESQVFSMRDAFFVASRGQFISRVHVQLNIREVKHDVYGKRQTAKIELLVSDFIRLYNLGKLFAFTVIKGFFSFFSTGFI